MKKKRVMLPIQAFPSEIASFLCDADIFDSSCSEEARVYYIEKGDGFYLKTAAAGALKAEALMHTHFHELGLTSKMVVYKTAKGADYLISERVPGEDCRHGKYLANSQKLCDTIAAGLRMIHDQPIDKCPVQDRSLPYVKSLLEGYAGGKYEGSLFEGLWEFSSVQEAWQTAKEGIGSLENTVLIHGDYCLPNILLDDWKISGFIDLGNAGIGDRHIDILWGIWTMKYNLHTVRYTDRFIDAYGRDAVDRDKLRSIVAMEMFL